MALNDKVTAVLVFEDKDLVEWTLRDNVELAPESEREALIFQRLMTDALLRNREKYVGKMRYNITSYDTVDLVHLSPSGKSSNKKTIFLILLKRPYNTEVHYRNTSYH